MSMLWPDITTWPDITNWPGDDTPLPTIPTPLLRPEATVTLTVDGGPVVDVMEGRVTLDDGWSPYVQAELTVPWTSVEVAETIDPQEDQRVTVEATEAVGGSTRTFDLALRGRRIRHKRRVIELELASDEALLIDKRRLADTPDTTPRIHEASLRAICEWALDEIDAELEAGAADADLTAYWEVKNLIPNPNCRVDTAGWGTTIVGSGTGVLSRQVLHESIVPDGQSPGFRARLLMSSASSGLTLLRYGTGTTTNIKGFQPGRRYWVTGWLYQNSGASKTQYVWVGWKDDANGTLKSDPRAGGTIPHDQWTRFAVPFVAPAAGTTAAIEVGIADGMPNGTQVSVAGLMFCESEFDPGRWFDGARTADFGYTYAYDGDDLASASVRTPDVERRPELFSWLPGTSLWDFLQPLTEAAGLRLFCDETRTWRLVDLSTYSVPGQVVVQEKVNAIEGEDEITRNDDSWATGVVAVYRWTDENGIRQEAYDYAGTDNKVVTFEYDTPHPGPGAAQALLSRLAGKGRTQTVQRLVDYTATPGMGANISLPGTLPQAGQIRQVQFDLKTGLMDIATRGLTEITPGSWAEVDDDLEWDDIPTTDAYWDGWS